MPLKTYATKDEVPEKDRANAIETKDGKFLVEEVDPALGEAGKAALQKERDKAKSEKDRADAAEKERDELKRAADAAAKGITKEQLDKIRDDEAKARKPLEDENAKLKVQLRKVQLEDRLKERFLNAKGHPKRISTAMKELLTVVDLTEDGNDFVVKDEKGNITTTKLDDYLGGDFRKNFPYLYLGAGGSGGGGDAGNEGGTTGSYDPVKAGKDAAAQDKAQAAGKDLAFR